MGSAFWGLDYRHPAHTNTILLMPIDRHPFGEPLLHSYQQTIVHDEECNGPGKQGIQNRVALIAVIAVVVG